MSDAKAQKMGSVRVSDDKGKPITSTEATDHDGDVTRALDVSLPEGTKVDINDATTAYKLQLSCLSQIADSIKRIESILIEAIGEGL